MNEAGWSDWVFAGKRSVIAGLVMLAGIVGCSGDASADTVVYRCQDGITFNAIFDNKADALTLEFNGGIRIVLNSRVSGSGMRYTGGGYELYGKADWANVTRPGSPELRCKEIGRIDAAPTTRPAQTANPSFSCSGNLNPTERRICSNPTLAKLDREVADVYSWLFGQLPTARHAELKQDQRQWLKQRNRCGSNDRCIEGEVAERVGYLNEYLEPEPAPPVQTGMVSFPVPAQSWGGIVRTGPGQRYKRVASLREGEQIVILEQTGEYFQDRPWFKIKYRGRIGYHWGGIICAKNKPIPGTFQVCN